MKQQLRRTMLYVPGNQPGMVSECHIYGSDCIMFDLEDSVALSEKDSARQLVFEALKNIDYADKELVVRINALDTPFGMRDLELILQAKPVVIRLPKAESADDILRCEAEIERIERELAIKPGSVKMMAAVESAQGALNAHSIAKGSKRLVAIAIGAEDYVTDLKTKRSDDGTELLFARSMVLLAARAAGIDAIDTVYSDVNNEKGFLDEIRLIKKLGFDGKSIINPRQIQPVHSEFEPSEKEIQYSLDVVEAIDAATSKGLGVAALNGKMIDKPIVERAKRVLSIANMCGLLKEEVLSATL